MGVPYPFSAIVGMTEMRLALLLNAVSPAIGGVLVRGEKGTAKSTMVRALAGLLPQIDVTPGCRFSCDPLSPYAHCPDGPHSEGTQKRRARLVELPVGATEDRLAGSLDLERVLTAGQSVYEPGLLAQAHRGVLYVDEVNLLHDHLVDLLLDAAAMGESYVERDGISVRHAARFLLVGTMNPEEGELRPQLLDRFGLTVDAKAPLEPAQRAQVVRRRLAYEADPVAFAGDWAAADEALAIRIDLAKARVSKVDLPDAELNRIAHVCAAFGVDGMRADIVVSRTAIALAAWEGRDVVTAEDVRVAARLALPHRRRRNPFDPPDLDESLLQQALDSAPSADDDDDPPPSGGRPPSSDDRDDSGAGTASDPGVAGEGRQDEGPAGGEATQEPAAAPKARLFLVPGVGTGATGRRSPAYTRTGRTVGSASPSGRLSSLHLAATVRAAAPHQNARGRVERLVLLKHDLREQVRQGKESNLVLFCVDASGSMAARQRMSAVKGAVLSLLLDAYQRRDKVGLITFRGDSASLALPPTSSVEAGAARLRHLPTGGRTPLSSGLLKAAETLRVERLRDPARRALLVVVTDGRATSGTRPVAEAQAAAQTLAAQGVAAIVVDCESGVVRLGLAAELAAHLRAELVSLDSLTADTLSALTRRAA
ncbi:putative cobaltochelatase [Catelliglobosispora koreensis]|uniref:putative cobaltochelatase n=1 Tax=Catelliglobosispora koreensis TaxID=129052 RepID=UPI00037EED2E|nr:putative cobaltochelatase [Catelliglobosispora koreensis]